MVALDGLPSCAGRLFLRWPNIVLVALYACVCVIYVSLRAAKSIPSNAVAYGVIVLVSEVLGIVSLMFSAINLVYRVSMVSSPIIPSPVPSLASWPAVAW